MFSWVEIYIVVRLFRVLFERLEGVVIRRVMVSLRVLGR